MRTEKEMLSLIQAIALADDHIRAAYMEGSRVNPAASKDLFQDYDIVYIVDSTAPYRQNKDWILHFGAILYMQYPEDNVFYPSDVENCYGWQVQFTDGNRLDLHVCTAAYALSNLECYQMLVDKDGLLPQPALNDDACYWVKAPQEAEFQSSYSDFWWCLNNVAKGLWRKEIPYVMDMLNEVLRPELLRLLAWKIGYEHDFCVSVGKSGKYMHKYLSQSTYQQFLATYPAADLKQIQDAVLTMCTLYDQVALELSHKLNFFYDQTMAANSLTFFKHLLTLPDDAKAIY